MTHLLPVVDSAAVDTSFSGVVRVDRGGEVEIAVAYGDANRAHGLANDIDTQFGIASGGKGFTALAVVRLVADGTLDLGTTARSVLGDDLALIHDEVTVEHLLAHRSGIGDYLDEDAGGDISDYVMPIPVHELATTEEFLRVLDGYPMKFPPGERFSYCNGGYVVLALIAERAAGVPYHDLVLSRVCRPAGMGETDFLRSDELPGRAAVGYLDTHGLRSNVLHLPVRANGDGGVYSTVADIHSFWRALFEGSIIGHELVDEMVRPRSVSSSGERYGLGFWLHPTRDVVMLEGYDAGVSFRTAHDPASGVTYTVVSNTSKGAWPIVQILDEQLFG